jgi:peptidoglycan/xylan/chitin deacetylase (PgdA/CDA1 family)
MPGVATHLLAPINRAAASALTLPRTLGSASGVALTFDDGPHPEGTPMMLDVLARHGATATFFVVGEQVRQRPALLAAVRAQGHQVALHGDRHRLQLRLGRAAGLTPLLWSRWGKDWRRLTTPERIVGRATGGLLPGDVILLHDADFYSSRGSHRRTAAAVEMILVELSRRKLCTVLASDVVARAHTG